MIKFIEFKETSVYGQDCTLKKLGDVILALDEIRGIARLENDTEHAHVMMREGVTLMTATTYEEIKSKLIEEDK